MNPLFYSALCDFQYIFVSTQLWWIIGRDTKTHLLLINVKKLIFSETCKSDLHEHMLCNLQKGMRRHMLTVSTPFEFSVMLSRGLHSYRIIQNLM